MSSGLLSKLPAELRIKIYALLFHPNANRIDTEDGFTTYDYGQVVPLLQTNRQIYYEARDVFRRLNVFVCIETPWPQAKDHVGGERLVPIVLKERRAATFQYSSLRASIDAPSVEALGLNTERDRFVILSDDLSAFTRAWYYIDLDNPGLNSHLRLTLELLAPYATQHEETTMKKDLQRQLVLPFSAAKSLRSTEFVGDLLPYKSVAKELADAQAENAASPEQCLANADRLKDLGNTELAAGRYREALEMYRQSWEAMHIQIRGDTRHVHAEYFFGRMLTEAPYTNKNGQTERLRIRVDLVANTCLAYLKLGDNERCILWGMRSIKMLREALGIEGLDLGREEEASSLFPDSRQFGSIYRWTATAYKNEREPQLAYELFNIARHYLKPEANAILAEMADLHDGSSSSA